jgi:hypothetical protein
MRGNQSPGDADFKGSGDIGAGASNLSTRFRRHADMIESVGRSPLSVALMRGAADDLDADGILSELLDGIELPPGQAPALRVLGALHRLVLSGQAPDLARYYPSVGGEADPSDVWPVADRTLRARARAARRLLDRGVQTNEPGRSTVLFGVLLWLTERHRMPIRLFELGASAGLNLLAPDYAYRIGGTLLGDPASPLVFEEPWLGRPVHDPGEAGRLLEVIYRRGCDKAPIDPTSEEGRLSLLSFIWPDEADRIARIGSAFDVAQMLRPVVDRSDAGAWISRKLTRRASGVVDVLWQSVVAQYVSLPDYRRLSEVITGLGEDADSRTPLVWARMEPGREPTAGFWVTVRCWPGGAETTLGIAADHGPPVRWSE